MATKRRRNGQRKATRGPGGLVFKARKEKKLSQRALANATGLSHNFICEIESGKKRPGLDSVGPLCRALGLDPSIFLGGSRGASRA